MDLGLRNILMKMGKFQIFIRDLKKIIKGQLYVKCKKNT